MKCFFIHFSLLNEKRYVCGVAECSYLSIDEGMLRSHVKALHPDEPYFRCPHCPAPMPGHDAQNIAIEKMGVHLKMHDTRLYKCSHCNHHHYHRFVKTLKVFTTPFCTQKLVDRSIFYCVIQSFIAHL